MNQRSHIQITGSNFKNCQALTRGGVFAAVNYLEWRILNSTFSHNEAGSEGSDIYV